MRNLKLNERKSLWKYGVKMVELFKGRQRIIRARHSGDIAFQQSLGNVTDYEDVPNFASWSETEITGKANTGGAKPQQFAGMQNKFWGTNASLLGAKIGNLTDRGKRKDTTRERRKEIYLE
jgi:hypothetical protein